MDYISKVKLLAALTILANKQTNKPEHISKYKIDIKDFKKLPKLLAKAIGLKKDYFLTGGCWGMALAIHALLKKNGYSPKLKLNEGHAYVQVGNIGIDATGIFDASDEKYEYAATYSVREFKETARDYGPPHGADIEAANYVLEDLIDLCNRKK